MKRVFIVLSDACVIFGVFSDMSTAIACKNYFTRRLEKSKLFIETDVIDLLDEYDYEG